MLNVVSSRRRNFFCRASSSIQKTPSFADGKGSSFIDSSHWNCILIFFFSIFHKCLESEFHACLALPLMTELMNFTFSLGFIFFQMPLSLWLFPLVLGYNIYSACTCQERNYNINQCIDFQTFKNNKTLYSNKMSMCKTDRVMR